MGTPDAIKYELGLTVIGLIVFWIWQTVTLRRDMRKTAQEDEQARQREQATQDAVPTPGDARAEPQTGDPMR